MLTKNKVKNIRLLAQKKHRTEQGLFVAEGPKVVGDLLETGPAETIVATDAWLRNYSQTLRQSPETLSKEIIAASDEELQKVSFLQHPQQVMAVFTIPKTEVKNTSLSPNVLSIALDGIQDPGNLGTIIRIADWFGIRNIFCSAETADAYNPKVVQATMGSIARVRVVYTDLPSLIKRLPKDFPVYGTLLDGESIYTQELTPNGLLIMGNEGNGLSPAVRRLVNRRLLIPSYSLRASHAESLNVAIATAVTCAEFRRRQSFGELTQK